MGADIASRVKRAREEYTSQAMVVAVLAVEQYESGMEPVNFAGSVERYKQARAEYFDLCREIQRPSAGLPLREPGEPVHIGEIIRGMRLEKK